MFQVVGDTWIPFGLPFSDFAAGPVIFGAVEQLCALLPWQRPTRVMITAAETGVYPVDGDDGSIAADTRDEPQTLTC